MPVGVPIVLQTRSAILYSNALSASSQNLIYCAMDNLLNDKVEFNRYKLNDLDELRLSFLRDKFQFKLELPLESLMDKLTLE